MNTDFERIRQIFLAIVEQPAAQWQALLNEACGTDAELCRQVALLLKAHAGGEGILDRDEAGRAPTGIHESLSEGPGTVIGPYKLLQQIGEGGMGTVFMAEQTQPVRRKVALKVIKAGMDTRQVIARFEAERQALAMMDHLNIALVLDVGATDTGRPYFVMELVHGVPITKYCDDNHLTPRERLELFVPVCQAIQHAHQKGIIHRDIKPSNVMITLYDGKPVPKVIDFGVAKATEQPLTERTMFTQYGTIVGTLEYMSPEQAEMSGLGVDTRGDIYSLGVLLYELLTGSTPLERPRLREAAYAEVLRLIREEEAPRPSARLSSSDTLPAIAAARKTEPAKLARLVRGELDWIVLKALEKDRTRRYETASGFAADVLYYLADEPVQACPPTAGYRFRKFVRRNKGPVVAASVIVLCLVGGIIGTSAGLVWAVRERDDKAKALIAEIKEREAKETALAAETKARLAEKQARDTALAALRAMTDEIVENQMARGTQLSDENKEFLRKIIKHYEGFAAVTADDAESRAIRAEGYASVAVMHLNLGELQEAETANVAALALYKQLAADFPTRAKFRENLARCHIRLGNLFSTTGRPRQAETAYGDGLAIQKQLAADFPAQPEFRHGRAISLDNLALLLSKTGRPKEAQAVLDDVLATLKQLVADFPKRPEFRQSLAHCYGRLGFELGHNGRLQEATTASAAALALWKELTADFPRRAEFRQNLARSHQSLGVQLRDFGRLKEAEGAYADALAVLKHLAADFPTRPEFRDSLAKAHLSLGQLLRDARRLKEAERAYADALILQQQLAADFRMVPEYRQQLARSHNALGLLLLYARRPKDAEEAYAAALAIQKPLAVDFPMRPDFRQDLARSYNDLGFLLFTTDRPREAEEAYTAALARRKQDAAQFPNQPEVRNDLAGTCVNLAILHLGQRDFKAARAYLNDAVPHHESARKAKPGHPIYRQFYRNNLIVLIQTNAGLGDKGGAKQAAQTLCDLGSDPPGDAYDAACYLSLCIPIIRKDDRATKEARDKQAAFYGDEAMKMLRNAVARGWKNAGHMTKDTDLDPLRGRADFQKLLAELLGPDHPDTLASMHNLARSYAELGRHADAVKLFQETLALRKGKLGRDHPDTLQTMHNLAHSYAELGRHADAVKLSQEALALRKIKLGRDHPDTLASMHNLALSYCALGRHADAVKLHEETLALQKAKQGPDHSDTLMSMWGLAESLVKLDRGAEAVRLIDECLKQAAGKVVHPRLIPAVMDIRLRYFEKAKDAAGCRQTAELWEQLKRTDAASLYDAACMRAVTAAVLLANDKSEKATKAAAAEADRAMAWLKQAVAAGYKNAAHMKKDTDLNALRNRPDFQKLLAQIEGKQAKDKR